MTPPPHAYESLLAQLQTLGVERGAVLVVHTSFRAVGPVVGGPAGLIAALSEALGPDGTLVMPTMTDGEGTYDAATTPTHEMGVVAETFWRLPGVVRSPHPGASFAAQGPQAESICAAHPLSPPHGHKSPVGRVYDAGGQVLLLGVLHSENTTMHLAEDLARVPYAVVHPCVVVEDGVAVTMDLAEPDHCCQNFNRVDAVLRARGLQREGLVGNAPSRLCRSRDVVDVALELLRADTLAFLCAAEAGCDDCDAARASVGLTVTRTAKR
jgi:aminoglycoside 3-N-acetyltransferase